MNSSFLLYSLHKTSLVSLATSKSETPVRPVVSMAIVNGKDSDMGEKDNTS